MKEPNLIIENLKAILEECTASEDAVSYVNSEDAGTLKAAIEALEKQEQDRWIPVTERLPEESDYDETFIATIQCEHVDGWNDYVTGFADWTPHGWDIQSSYLGQIKVVAWRPLPEPYTEEEA